MAGIKHQEQVIGATKTARPKPPALYKVLLLNDDFTPMDFVVEVLEVFFAKNREQATLIMLQVHNNGSGVCGVYPLDIAETKINQVQEHAQQSQHPLQCVMQQM